MFGLEEVSAFYKTNIETFIGFTCRLRGVKVTDSKNTRFGIIYELCY